MASLAAEPCESVLPSGAPPPELELALDPDPELEPACPLPLPPEEPPVAPPEAAPPELVDPDPVPPEPELLGPTLPAGPLLLELPQPPDPTRQTRADTKIVSLRVFIMARFGESNARDSVTSIARRAQEARANRTAVGARGSGDVGVGRPSVWPPAP